MKKLMNDLNVFDGRNIYSNEEMKDLGFNYECIGVRPTTSLSTKKSTKLKLVG
jgi:UDPglucose 6-dehydrogenase